MSSRSDKYIIPFLCGAVGLVAIASPLFLKFNSVPNYVTSQQNISEQQMQRLELEERKKTTDTIKRTGLPVRGRTLTIVDYLDNPDRMPRLGRNTLNRYANKEVWVFDGADACIGRIIDKKFVSKYSNPAICEELPNDNGQ